MKLTCVPCRGLLPIACLCLAGLATAAWFSSSRAHAVEPAAPVGAIGDSMHKMEEALKALSKPVTAETRAASLEALANFETAVIAAKAETPESASKVDEKKRAAFVADYRKTLVDALKLACDAETAILNDKYKDADGLIRNKLGGMKSSGHSKFKGEGGGK